MFPFKVENGWRIFVLEVGYVNANYVHLKNSFNDRNRLLLRPLELKHEATAILDYGSFYRFSIVRLGKFKYANRSSAEPGFSDTIRLRNETVQEFQRIMANPNRVKGC